MHHVGLVEGAGSPGECLNYLAGGRQTHHQLCRRGSQRLGDEQASAGLRGHVTAGLSAMVTGRPRCGQLQPGTAGLSKGGLVAIPLRVLPGRCRHEPQTLRRRPRGDPSHRCHRGRCPAAPSLLLLPGGRQTRRRLRRLRRGGQGWEPRIRQKLRHRHAAVVSPGSLAAAPRPSHSFTLTKVRSGHDPLRVLPGRSRFGALPFGSTAMRRNAARRLRRRRPAAGRSVSTTASWGPADTPSALPPREPAPRR